MINITKKKKLIYYIILLKININLKKYLKKLLLII